MQRVQVRVERANYGRSKGTALRAPDYLNFAQIAEVINKAMAIRLITLPGTDTPTLAVFNGETYDTDTREIRKAIIKLYHKATEKTFKDVISRLMTICEKAEVNSDENLEAVYNGILDKKENRLMPFDEKYVFLSKSDEYFIKNRN